MSATKKIETVKRGEEFMPAIISRDSGKVIKLLKDHAREDEDKVNSALSNKAKVYLAWEDGEKDLEALHQLVDEAVKLSTVRGWLSGWRNDRNLPAIATK